MRARQEGKDLIYNPRTTTNSELRSTYNAKSPFRENFKKDISVKNHQKCVEVMSLAISLSAYENIDALALSYLFIKNVEKELTAMQESARKECELKSDDPMMKNLLDILYV